MAPSLRACVAAFMKGELEIESVETRNPCQDPPTTQVAPNQPELAPIFEGMQPRSRPQYAHHAV
ncbi:MAG: hypothetical protein ACLUHA_01815 [Bacteroides stercoris]